MKHFLLIYDTAPDYLDRRAEFRDAHLALAWAAADRGELILGGALGDPVDGAALLFKAPSPHTAEEFASSSPAGECTSGGRWWVMMPSPPSGPAD